MPGPRPLRLTRYAVLGCYFGLLTLVVLWPTWLAPPQRLPVAPILLLAGLPLLLALRGLLYQRLSTHTWLSLLALAYLSHGVIECYTARDAASALLAALEAILAAGLNIGAALFVRLRARQLREAASGPSAPPGP